MYILIFTILFNGQPVSHTQGATVSWDVCKVMIGSKLVDSSSGEVVMTTCEKVKL